MMGAFSNGLGQYQTAQSFSELLVAKIQCQAPRSILDLGVGTGMLTSAAYRRWNNAKFYGTDIDKDSIKKISAELPFVRLFHIDGLSPCLAEEMNLKIGSIDIAICNPPYYRMERSLDIRNLFRRAGLRRSVGLPRITSEVRFLAQNLHMLKDGGELGIILPDGVLSSHEYSLLRQDLLTDHEMIGAIQLPDNVFARTEARTHILLLRKNGSAREECPVFRAGLEGQIENRIDVPTNTLAYRMDYSYHSWRSHQKLSAKAVSLADLNVEIKRGRREKKRLEDACISYFHTTSFPENESTVVDLPTELLCDDTLAEAGDVLLARVGKRCIGKVAMVRSGRQVVTDCVYRIRSREYAKKIWRAFISDSGQEWLRAHSHGVCSRVISKADLLSFRIEV
ncbi:MAG: SAM-dependent DNA methyltransferase [bacterium]|nr:SAM-dependent DNA methyltransferase [bacterium]